MSGYPTSPSPSPCLHSPNVCAAFNGKVETCFPQVAPAQLFCCCLCLCLLLLGLFEVQGRILFACSVQGERGRPRGGTGHIQKKKRGFISHTHTRTHLLCGSIRWKICLFSFPIFLFSISHFRFHFIFRGSFFGFICFLCKCVQSPPVSVALSLFPHNQGV